MQSSKQICNVLKLLKVKLNFLAFPLVKNRVIRGFFMSAISLIKNQVNEAEL
jgi:hypothetical protein